MSDVDDPNRRTPDPDDWFSSPGPARPVPTRRRVAAKRSREASEPAWLDDETREAAEPLLPANLDRRRLALLGAVAFAAIVGIAYGASSLFGGGKSSNPPVPPVTQPQTTTVQQTTPPPTTTQKQVTVPVLTSGLLHQGTSGAEVKAMQQALAAAGQSPGKIDGVFGAQTEQALIAFQKAAGIPADGVYGPTTKTALEKKLQRG